MHCERFLLTASVRHGPTPRTGVPKTRPQEANPPTQRWRERKDMVDLLPSMLLQAMECMSDRLTRVLQMYQLGRAHNYIEASRQDR